MYLECHSLKILELTSSVKKNKRNRNQACINMLYDRTPVFAEKGSSVCLAEEAPGKLRFVVTWKALDAMILTHKWFTPLQWLFGPWHIESHVEV